MEWLIALGVAVLAYGFGWGHGRDAMARHVARLTIRDVLRWGPNAGQANRAEIAP